MARGHAAPLGSLGLRAGWAALGDAEHAAIEADHALMWQSFRAELGDDAHEPCEETRALADHARGAFADPVTALGALYAFEAQQPATARSKLDGLRAHYAMPAEAVRYFEEHANDYGERDLLSRRAVALDAADLARAEEACEAMCRAMWRGLDGVMAAYGGTCDAAAH